MKVALIFPRLREQMHGMWPPLGIITLGTILQAAGHEVSCLDSSFDPGPERVLMELARTRPAVVGVSCLTDFFPVAAKLIAAAKAQGAVTVMGGPHPTIAPEDSLRCIPELDYAVMGEAERTLPALLEFIAAGTEPAGLPGLGFRRGDETRASLGYLRPPPDISSPGRRCSSRTERAPAGSRIVNVLPRPGSLFTRMSP